LIVVHRGVLIAAIELKALGAPSFGKNYNNRVEEALGNASDLAHAHLASLTGPELSWLGYFFLMQDDPKSRRPCRKPDGKSFPYEAIWEGRSYQDRFCVTGERLLDERMYDAVCYVVSSSDDPGPREPSDRLDWSHFSAALEARIMYLSHPAGHRHVWRAMFGDAEEEVVGHLAAVVEHRHAAFAVQ
jgi:hypothetical protein